MRTYIGNGNSLVLSLVANVLHHVFDEDGALSDLTICTNVSVIQSRAKCRRIDKLKCCRDVSRTHCDPTAIVALECKGSLSGGHVEVWLCW